MEIPYCSCKPLQLHSLWRIPAAAVLGPPHLLDCPPTTSLDCPLARRPGPTVAYCQLTAAVGILHRDCSCRPPSRPPQVEPFLAHRRNGAFITTCICHGCDWTDLEMDGKTSYAHYAAWAASLANGSAAVGEHVHIDRRPPDGGGALAAKCSSWEKFPPPAAGTRAAAKHDDALAAAERRCAYFPEQVGHGLQLQSL